MTSHLCVKSRNNPVKHRTPLPINSVAANWQVLTTELRTSDVSLSFTRISKVPSKPFKPKSCSTIKSLVLRFVPLTNCGFIISAIVLILPWIRILEWSAAPPAADSGYRWSGCSHAGLPVLASAGQNRYWCATGSQKAGAPVWRWCQSRNRRCQTLEELKDTVEWITRCSNWFDSKNTRFVTYGWPIVPWLRSGGHTSHSQAERSVRTWLPVCS